jgi:hypothetical protein
MSNKPHPEDEIYKVKTFINGLEKVQEEYFVRLVESLNLSKEGEDWLFDYIHNSSENEFDDFQHYLNGFNKKYEDMTKKDEMYIDSAETFLSTDFGEFSPMLHMSSYEPDLGIPLSTAFNEKEPISLGIQESKFDNLQFSSKAS